MRKGVIFLSPTTPLCEQISLKEMDMDKKTKKLIKAFYLLAATLIAIAACARGIPLEKVMPYIFEPTSVSAGVETSIC